MMKVVTSSVMVARIALTRSSSVDRISRVSACPKSADSADCFSLVLLPQIDIARIFPWSFRDGSKDQTSDVQLHIGESRDFGFDATRRPGTTEGILPQSSVRRKRVTAIVIANSSAQSAQLYRIADFPASRP